MCSCLLQERKHPLNLSPITSNLKRMVEGKTWFIICSTGMPDLITCGVDIQREESVQSLKPHQLTTLYSFYEYYCITLSSCYKWFVLVTHAK